MANKPVDIGFVTYFPPDLNGVGDYAHSLLSVPNPRLRVTLYTNIPNPKQIPSIAEYRHINDLFAQDRHEHDLLITTITNNMIGGDVMSGIAHKFGGVVHIHDGSLNHIIAGLRDFKIYSDDDYQRIYESWYGPKAFQTMKSTLRFWDTDLTMSYRGIGEICARADGVLVSNGFLANEAKAHFYNKPVEVVEQRYFDLPAIKRRRKEGEPWRLASYGYIAPHKKIYDIFFALKELPRDFDYVFDLVGTGNWITIENCYKLVEKLGLQKRVRFLTTLSQPRFLKHMSEVDLAIQLRYPTYGESSGICARIVHGGVPMVVTDIGSYVEYPSFVAKVPPVPAMVPKMGGSVKLAHEPADIAKAILHMTGPERGSLVGQQHAFMQKHRMSQKDYAEDYFRAALRMIGKENLLPKERA